MSGKMKQNFVQNQPVIIYGLGDGGKYNAIIKGLHGDEGWVDFYIVEMVDQIPGSKWTHCVFIETCIEPLVVEGEGIAIPASMTK